MAKQPAEIFMLPNVLKAKVGNGPAGGFDAVLKRAETAVDELKTEFSGWLSADVDRLVETRDRFAALCDAETQSNLFRASHDLKGGAQTYEFPLIGRIAASLCKLIDASAGPDAVPLALVDAHVDAVRVLFRKNIKDGTDKTAVTLTEELEARVIEALDKAR